MNVLDLIAMTKEEADCIVHPATTLPAIRTGLQLPDDVQTFYEECGGLVLFEHAPSPTHIVAPLDFVPANPVIVGEEGEYDVSYLWYLIASDGTDSQRMTIDLSSERRGQCYDSFWDRHGIVGSTTIIAVTFTDFLMQSLLSRGDDFYWHSPSFPPLGDAYDGLSIELL